jgi:uncharacterized membrane protein YphA (DoxX/SURF4 family)
VAATRGLARCVVSELAVMCRFVLATIFVLASVAKLARRSEFADAVRNYRLVPRGASEYVSRTLPTVELLVGVFLFLGLEIRAVSALAALCLLVFIIAITVNLLRGRRIDCGCFGLVTESHLSWFSAGRNALLLSAALLVVSRPVSLPPSTEVAWWLVASVAVIGSGLLQEAVRFHWLTKAMSRGSQ